MIKIIPYLMFGGNCEEALHFYQSIMGGEAVVQSRYDNPHMNVPDDWRSKVLHARLLLDGVIVLYASDTFSGHPVKQSSGDVSISIVLDDDLERTRRIYEGLAEGGKVGVPFAKQFWGDWHGNLTDRYGMRWNINFEEKR